MTQIDFFDEKKGTGTELNRNRTEPEPDGTGTGRNRTEPSRTVGFLGGGKNAEKNQKINLIPQIYYLKE